VFIPLFFYNSTVWRRSELCLTSLCALGNETVIFGFCYAYRLPSQQFLPIIVSAIYSFAVFSCAGNCGRSSTRICFSHRYIFDITAKKHLKIIIIHIFNYRENMLVETTAGLDASRPAKGSSLFLPLPLAMLLP